MGNITKKFASIAISVVTVASLSGFAMLAPVAHAQTSLQAQIDALLAQIAALQTQLASGGSSSSSAACNFTRDLTVGAKGDDVMCLQKYLNDGGNAKIAASGAGSPGNESTYFGSLTKAAVAKWQAANSLSPAVGYFGSKSRAKYASMAAGSTPAPVPGTPAPTPVGSGLTATLASDQPASGLFGESFASRPFTKIRLTASADGDVTVKTLTVERQGQGADAAFSGIVGLDEDGVRLGSSKTLGSDHRVRLTDSFIVKAGQTRTITLAGDSDSDQNDYGGQLVSLALVGVETSGSSAVNAVYPLVGNLMTVNSTLAIGNLTLARGAYDPGSGQTKEIGTVGFRFAGLRLTAGSNEDVLVKSIRFNQSGSAGSGDLANVKIVLDGVSYDTTVSSDGKYYTTKFGTGVKIEKGLSKELHMAGDIVGGSNRTVDFDLFRYEDLQVLGLTYGYSLTPSATEVAAVADDGNFHSSEPRWDAYQAQIGAGSITAQNAPTVGSQNVAINLPNQPIGGMIIDVKGEDVTVASMNFDLSATDDGGSVDTNDVTNITLVDESGKVVSGPVDGVAGGNNGIRFSDTVTFPVGRHTYTIKGKYGTDFLNGDTVAASTTPSTDWTTVKGTVSGVTITPSPASAVTTSTMTIRAASLVVTLAPDTNAGGSDASSTAQTVVAGTQGYEFTRYVMDASGSGEDVRVSSMALSLTFSSVNDADDLTNCQLWDAAKALTTGTNVINPSNSDTSVLTSTFTLDTPLTIPKGTIKTLSLKCNLNSGADNGQQWNWGLLSISTNINSTGLTSGQAITETGTTDAGRKITATTGGTLALVLDTSSPSLKWVRSGTTDNILAVFRLNASNEDIRVDTLGLQIATSTSNTQDALEGNASNTPQDLSQVTVWNGATQVGSAVFSATDYATATLTGVTVPKDGQILLTIKADIGNIGVGLAARPGHFVVVNYDAQSSADETNMGAVGVGLSSGTTIGSGGSDSAANGARIARAVPTVALVPLPSNSLAGGVSLAKQIFRYSVTAPASGNGVSLYKATFNVATSTANTLENARRPGSTYMVTNFKLYCYDNSSFSSPSCNTFDNSGLLNQGGLANTGEDRTSDAGVAGFATGTLSVYFNPTDSTGGSAKESIKLAAGETKYFALLADVTGASSTPSITSSLSGDATFASLNNIAGGSLWTPNVNSDADADLTSGGDNWSTGRYLFATIAANVDAWDDNDFVWSGNSTNTSQSIVDYDWFNGFLVPGLSNADQGTTQTLVGN